MNRVSTGIKGLDELIGGGFVEGSIILITGKAGTGKTLFCANFLYEGLKKGEPGIYVTTEQTTEELKKDIYSAFGWDFSVFENKNLLRFIQIKPLFLSSTKIKRDESNTIKLYIYDLLTKITNEAKAIKAKRIVIDSITLIESFIRDKYLRRVGLSYFIQSLKQLGSTILITSTILHTKPESLSLSGVVEFLVDGIIKLEYDPGREEFKRTISILKMRRTKHSEFIHPFEFTKDGIKIILV